MPPFKDYCTSNPELGWIEDGIIENVVDRAAKRTVGFFTRMVAGAWSDWRPGLRVRHSDSVVSDGGIWRVFDRPGARKQSTPRTHRKAARA